MASSTETEIKQWLENIFKNENFENLSVSILGNSEKGDGYLEDIIFLEAKGTTNNIQKNYNLVLKCAKRSKQFRKQSPVKEAFFNEIYFYDVVLPDFLLFQEEKGIKDPFDKVPKCYGTLSTDEKEVVALENLKTKGFFVWDRKTPLTRKHIDMMVQEYGKLHAISIAMGDQEAERLQRLAEKQYDVWQMFMESSGVIEVFENLIEELYDLLEDELEENVLSKWKDLKWKVRPFYENASRGLEGTKVICHGDCWSSNFMHYHTNGKPFTFAMLDWQLCHFTSPIVDLSYFLFSCIAEEDIEELETILKLYYSSLKGFVTKLGSNIDKLYPLNQFLEDWKKYCRYGIFLTNLTHKFAFLDNEDIPDLAETAEMGQDVASTFSVSVKNTEAFKNRRKYIIKYAAKNDLI